MKQLDVLMVSMPRSGSTMLANLMTYNNNWCMCEPHNHENRTKKWITKQAKALGRHVKSCDFENLPAQMKDFKKWGIKEIHKRHYIPINTQLSPAHYIILLRDVGEIFLSLRHFHYTQQDSHQKLYDRIVAWWRDIHEFVATIPNDKITVIYYDHLLDPEYRKELGEHLNWPLNGQPDLWLEHYNREYEKRGNHVERRLAYIPLSQDLDYMKRVQIACKKVLLSTLLIKKSSVMTVEDVLQGDSDV